MKKDIDHSAGCLLAGAVGDALGAPVAGLSGAFGGAFGDITRFPPPAAGGRGDAT